MGDVDPVAVNEIRDEGEGLIREAFARPEVAALGMREGERQAVRAAVAQRVVDRADELAAATKAESDKLQEIRGLLLRTYAPWRDSASSGLVVAASLALPLSVAVAGTVFPPRQTLTSRLVVSIAILSGACYLVARSRRRAHLSQQVLKIASAFLGALAAYGFVYFYLTGAARSWPYHAMAAVGAVVLAGAFRWVVVVHRARARNIRSTQVGKWPSSEVSQRLSQQTYSDWRNAVVDGIVGFIAECLMSDRPLAKDVTLPDLVRWDPLDEPFHAGRYVSTDAAEAVLRAVTRRVSGSIGLSGPRGVGKSSLLAMIAEHGRNNDGRIVTINIESPTQYEPTEFVSGLLAAVCEQFAEPADSTRRSAVLERLLRNALLVSAFILFIAAFGWTSVADGKQSFVGLLLTAGVLLFLLLGMYAVTRWLRQRASRVSKIEVDARRLLDELAYQRSETRGLDGRVQLPGGSVVSKFVVQRTRHSPTLFGRVAQFRAFVAEAGSHLASLHGNESRIIFCVDELDKLPDGDALRKLVGGIGALAGVARCHFVVAVSEEAMATFETRGLSARTAFDGAFDEVLKLSPASYDAARRILSHRCPGMPDPFVALCHGLSGGIPRELMRVARGVLSAHAGDAGPARRQLSEVAELLIRTDLADAVAGQLVKLREYGGSARPLALWLTQLDPYLETPASLEGHCTQGSPEIEGLADPELRLHAARAAALVYCAATSLRIFSIDVDALPREVERDPTGFAARMDALASARRWIPVEPAVAWRYVNRARPDRFRAVQPPSLLGSSVSRVAPAQRTSGLGRLGADPPG
ncbi:hypothetical protein [Asanoa sp. NPDC050611]|uniref:hypothetical protein n=1 Tax=Asanoa sp. NPDC050611 TaxID=3157098 RepID=UPI0033F8746D